MAGRIAVVGGANMDIGGFPDAALVAGDSNPGRVRMTPGGVGRNIAENLVRMGIGVELVTALGDDANGHAILADCHAKGIGVSAVQIEQDCATSVYLFVDDAQGDMSVAVNDMAIQQRITPDRLRERLELLNAMDAVVLDANLPEESILYLSREVRVPIFADAVSAAKVGKLKGALGQLHCLKPNRIEAELLTGMRIDGMEAAKAAAQMLLRAGLHRVVLTLGADGAVCAEGGQCVFLPSGRVEIVNASGAGDAYTAALVWSHCRRLSLRESAVAGMAASAIAMRSISAVNPEMTEEKLLMEMQRLFQQNI